MPEWKTKRQVETALTKARKTALAARAKHGGDSKEFKDAIKECNSIQQVLDRWDAIHSKWQGS